MQRRLRFALAAAALLTAAGLARAKEPVSAANAVTYTLGTQAAIQAQFPDASWLPEPYRAAYPDLAKTVQKFTLQSLQRDGVAGAKVDVSISAAGDVQVSIQPNNATTARYAKLQPAFFGPALGQAAVKAVAACKADPACWKDPSKPTDRRFQPWALFLPVGMAVANPKAIMFMDYPPAASLLQGDYLNNFSLCRWNQVLAGAGVADPVATNVIVDSRPIAAPGSGMDALLPDPKTWFDGPKGASYLTPMLQFRSARSDAAAATTLPVAVFGGTPRKTWGDLVGQANLKVGSVGSTALGGQRAKTPWLTTNHPDFTTYQCCPGDNDSSCKPDDRALVASEQIDFTAACWIKAMSGNTPPAADAAHAACQSAWATAPSAANKQAVCVQAKFDTQAKASKCSSYTEAWNYCAANNGNACATDSCSYDKAKATLPMPATVPPGMAKPCVL